MKSKIEQPEMLYVPKGWGYERWIVNNEKYCGKLLYFAKSRKCSFHYHKLKDETFYLQSGRIRVYFSDDPELFEQQKTPTGFVTAWGTHVDHTDLCDFVVLEPGDNFYVPQFRAHQMVAELDSELFEFSTQHFDSDSYRIISGD